VSPVGVKARWTTFRQRCSLTRDTSLKKSDQRAADQRQDHVCVIVHFDAPARLSIRMSGQVEASFAHEIGCSAELAKAPDFIRGR
jgi:hypothetical protein